MGLVIKNKMFSLDCKHMKTIKHEDTIIDDHICVINNFNDYGCYNCKSFEKVEKMTNDIDIDVILKNLDIERLRKNGIKLLELDVEDLTKDDNVVSLTATVSKIYSTYTILELFKTLNKDQIIELWEKINKEEVD